MPQSILAIDTTTPRGAVALVRAGVVEYEQSFLSERSHNAQLFAPLAEALALCGDSLDAIVVGTGPGSYTGARIGIAAAQGVALSRKVPVIGLPSVLAPEAVELPHEFVVCGDARRGKFFTAHVCDGLLLGGITQHDGDDFSQAHAKRSPLPWFSFDRKLPLDLADVTLTTPSARRLALLASAMTDETIWTLEQQPLEPHYLAAPFVTKAKDGMSGRVKNH